MTETRPDRVVGTANAEFWKYCGRRELRLQRCGACDRWSWPAVAACEHCRHAELRWETVSGHGTLLSWCTFERRYYSELPVPWDTILVALDEGPLFISNPARVARDELTVGMPLEVEFVPCVDTHGEYLLPAFGPVAS